MSEPETIQNNTWVILKRGIVLKSIKITSDKKQMFERQSFLTSQLIGKPFNTLWQVNKKGDLIKLDFVPSQESYDLTEDELNENGILNINDNRNLDDSAQESQKLTREDIEELKKCESTSNKDLIKKIAENSKNFDNKNKFSKKKFINRSTKKHVRYFCVMKPTARLINSCFEYRSPGQVQFLSADAVCLRVLFGGIFRCFFLRSSSFSFCDSIFGHYRTLRLFDQTKRNLFNRTKMIHKDIKFPVHHLTVEFNSGRVSITTFKSKAVKGPGTTAFPVTANGFKGKPVWVVTAALFVGGATAVLFSGASGGLVEAVGVFHGLVDTATADENV